MRQVIIDTNFWLLPFERKVDIFAQIDRLLDEPCKMVAPQAVVDELEGMVRGRGKRAVAARGALSLILSNAGKSVGLPPWIEIDGQKGRADGVIITVALQRGALVATSDVELRDRLKRKGIRCIILRDGHKVDFA